MAKKTNKTNLAIQIVERADRHAGQPRDQIPVQRLLNQGIHIAHAHAGSHGHGYV